MNKCIHRASINEIAREYNKVLYTYILNKYPEQDISMEEMFSKLVIVLGDILEIDNKSFDRKRFYEAIYKEKVK